MPSFKIDGTCACDAFHMASHGKLDRMHPAQFGITGAGGAFLRCEKYSYRPMRCLGFALRSSLLIISRVKPFLWQGIASAVQEGRSSLLVQYPAAMLI